jgi:hypothetical protein
LLVLGALAVMLGGPTFRSGPRDTSAGQASSTPGGRARVRFLGTLSPKAGSNQESAAALQETPTICGVQPAGTRRGVPTNCSAVLIIALGTPSGPMHSTTTGPIVTGHPSSCAMKWRGWICNQASVEDCQNTPTGRNCDLWHVRLRVGYRYNVHRIWQRWIDCRDHGAASGTISITLCRSLNSGATVPTPPLPGYMRSLETFSVTGAATGVPIKLSIWINIHPATGNAGYYYKGP